VSAFDSAWIFLKAKEKFRRRRDDEPHIHWMTPDFENNPVGWLNMKGPYIDLHEHPNYPDGFYQTVSGHEEKGPLPWKNHEIVDGEVREKDLSGPVEGLPGMFFDAKGNLVGGQ
jgi:hypothetical protein